MNTVPQEPSPDGSAPGPVPGGLPTVQQPGTVFQITGGASKTPTWVWWLGGAVLAGAVVGAGYYVTRNRPDLFRSRAKKRR